MCIACMVISMLHSNLHCLPTFLSILFIVTFIGAYIAAAVQGQVGPGLPFISDAAQHAPQSCFVGQALNIAAALMSLCVYIRHRQLLSQRPPHRPSLRLLKAGLWTGWTSALGVSMVANFQMSNMTIIHLIGAFMVFGVGIVYLWIQVFCTRYDSPETLPRLIFNVRWLLASTATFSFVLTIVGTVTASSQRNKARSSADAESNGAGWAWFLVGTISEWLMALSMAAFIATLAREFRHVTIATPQILEPTQIETTKNTDEEKEQQSYDNEAFADERCFVINKKNRIV